MSLALAYMAYMAYSIPIHTMGIYAGKAPVFQNGQPNGWSTRCDYNEATSNGIQRHPAAKHHCTRLETG